MKLANVDEIDSVDFNKYRTCRDYADRKYFEDLIRLMVDESVGEDERSDALIDGLWDIFSHQYTLYSATPLALYLILKLLTPSQRESNEEIQRFIELCEQRGNRGIYLTEDELIDNNNGSLPIFSIPEVLRKYA